MTVVPKEASVPFAFNCWQSSLPSSEQIFITDNSLFRIVKIKITIVTLITSYTNLAILKLDTHISVQTLIDFTRTLLAFRFVRFLVGAYWKSTCVNMVMQIQVQIGDTRTSFLRIPLGVLRLLKKIQFAWDSKDTFMDFGLLYENDVAWQTFALLLLFTCLFTLACISCFLHFCVKTSHFNYSIWATLK